MIEKIIKEVYEDIKDSGASFSEVMQVLREQGIKNQKVLTTLLTAIGRVYKK